MSRGNIVKRVLERNLKQVLLQTLVKKTGPKNKNIPGCLHNDIYRM